MMNISTRTGKEKQLNIELIRIFSMLLICLWHVNSHFLPLVPSCINKVSGLLNYINLFITFHVDLFILITGYFGIKSRWSGIIKTSFLIIFYVLVLNIVCSFHDGVINNNTLLELLPFSSSPWWFLQVYLVLVCIAPIIENYVERCYDRQFYIMLFTALLLSMYLGWFRKIAPYNNHGYDIFNFIQVYIIGVWIRRRKDRLNILLEKHQLLPFIIFLACCIIRYYVQPLTFFDWYDYSSPLNIVMAICFFYIFLRIRVPKTFMYIINFFSSSAVAAYLITDYHGMYSIIAQLLGNILEYSLDPKIQLVNIIIFVIFEFCVCCIIDKIRIVLSKPLLTAIFSRFIKN